MADKITDPAVTDTADDGSIRSKWGRCNGDNNFRSRVLPPGHNRDALLFSITGYVAQVNVYLGPPWSPQGTFIIPNDPASQRNLQLFLTRENDGNLVDSEIWVDSDLNPGDGAYVEIWCCKR